jgi:hypothetical protein
MSTITKPGPGGATTTLREAKEDFGYVWLVYRKPPDPHPYWRIIQSHIELSEFGPAGTTVHLIGRKLPRQDYRNWRIIATFRHGDQVDGPVLDLDEDRGYAFGCADGRLKLAAGIQLGKHRVSYEPHSGPVAAGEAIGLLLAAILLAGFAIHTLLA